MVSLSNHGAVGKTLALSKQHYEVRNTNILSNVIASNSVDNRSQASSWAPIKQNTIHNPSGQAAIQVMLNLFQHPHL